MTADRVHRNLDYIKDIPEKIELRFSNKLKRSYSLARKLARKISKLSSRQRLFASHVSSTKPSGNKLSAPRDNSCLDNSGIAQPIADNTFILYRIIGNDLYPRHNDDQSVKNLEFILEHEPSLQGCEKRWILNRIRNPERLNQLRSLLDAHNLKYDTIPFKIDEFLAVPWDWDILPFPSFFASRQFRSLSRHQRQSWELAFYRLKNNYLMNNNGARNHALALGRNSADYILPWDGNCFVTESAWRDITTAISGHSEAEYFYVPMQRVSDNSDLLDQSFCPEPKDEPQLIFKNTASEIFNPDYGYGRRPKVELLWLLGVHGIWDEWADEPWDQPRRPTLSPPPAVLEAGWVARLHSGVHAQDLKDSATVLSQQSRYSARNYAIRASINQAIYEQLAVSRSVYSAYWRQPAIEASAFERLDHISDLALDLLGRWAAWWQSGFQLSNSRPPLARQHQLLSAFAHLLWRQAVASEMGDVIDQHVCETINLFGNLLFLDDDFRLKPKLRLLRRPLAYGRLAGTWPNLQSVEQIVAISDLLAWKPVNSPWQPAFDSWRNDLSFKLQSLLNHHWLARVPGDLERLQIATLLLRRHQGDIAESIDVMSSLVSCLMSDPLPRFSSEYMNLILDLAPQYGFPVAIGSNLALCREANSVPAPSLAQISD